MMDNDNVMYLIVMVVNTSGIEFSNDDFWDNPTGLAGLSDDDWDAWLNGQSYEPVALYSDFEDANYWMEQLIDQVSGTPDESTIGFDIIGLEIDKEGPPALLTDLQEEEAMLRKTVEDILIKLMKEGLVDQLIGEDGRFYYEITDLGKDKIKNMPPHIKDYFKDKE